MDELATDDFLSQPKNDLEMSIPWLQYLSDYKKYVLGGDKKDIDANFLLWSIIVCEDINRYACIIIDCPKPYVVYRDVMGPNGKSIYSDEPDKEMDKENSVSYLVKTKRNFIEAHSHYAITKPRHKARLPIAELWLNHENRNRKLCEKDARKAGRIFGGRENDQYKNCAVLFEDRRIVAKMPLNQYQEAIYNQTLTMSQKSRIIKQHHQAMELVNE